MLSHAQIWAAIDRLATRAGLSASGLAKRAGLDPTTFNKSKRITRQGRERWPSTESVAKSLAATGVSIEDFVALMTDAPERAARTLPSIDFPPTGAGNLFDAAGRPVGERWAEIPFPLAADENAYALKITGDALQPTFRDGTTLVVSPSAPPRRGDRVIVMLRTGELVPAELRRPPGKTIEVRSLAGAAQERSLAADDVAFMARILWASQ
jgi:phage repressor protein C with HTH and peptisase S24 domain